MPPILPWMIIAIAGAATTISYAILPGYFAQSMSARANAALNLLHLLTAFGVQCAIGGIVDLWPEIDGHPPPEAYRSALGIVATLQAVAMVWFVIASQRRHDIVLRVRHPLLQALAPEPRLAPRPSSRAPYADALAIYARHVATARSHRQRWRGMAVAAGVLCAAMATAVVSVTSSRVIAHVVHAGQRAAVDGRTVSLNAATFPRNADEISRDARGRSSR